jgi:hypothetical protein
MNPIPELITLFKPAFILISFTIGVFVIGYLSNLLIKKHPKGKVLIYPGAVLAVILLLYPYFYLAYPSDTFSYLLKALISLPLIFFIPGYVMFNAFVKDHDLSFLEVVFIQILGSILISGWIGLILAELGYFSLVNLLALLIVFSCVLGLKFKVRINAKFYPKPNINHFSLLLIIIVSIGVILFFQPMFTNFGADDGILVPHGVNIAKTGSIIAQDPIIENMEGPVRSKFYQQVGSEYLAQCEYLQFPGYGFYVDSKNIIRFQYFDFFPILLAIFYSLFSIENFLYINSFIAILSILCIFVLARRLFNTHVAVLSSLFLTINFAQIFFARYPGAEILDQLLIFGGIYTIMLMIKTNNPFYGILSAFAFSGCLITRVDSLLLYFPIIVLLFLLILTEKFKKEYFYFFIPFLLLSLHVWSHIYLFDLPYFVDQFRVIGYELWYLTYSLFLVAILSMVIFISVLLRKYRYKIRLMISPLKSRTKTLKLANSIFLVSVFVFLYFIRPQLDPNISTGGTILLLEQALTIVGLLLATYGIIKLTNEYLFSDAFTQKDGIIMSFFLFIGVSYTLFYLISLKNNPVQPWLFRRYITVSIPFLIILMSYGATKIVGIYNKQQFTKIAYILIVLFLVISFSNTTITTSFLGIPITKNSESILLQTKNLANNFDDKDIVIMSPARWEEGFGIIMKYLFDKNAIVMPDGKDMPKSISVQINKWLNDSRKVYVINPLLFRKSLRQTFNLTYKSVTTINSSPRDTYSALCIFEVKNKSILNNGKIYLLTNDKPPLIFLKYGSINNLAKIVQFQHPTSQIQYDVLVPQNATLKFSIALEPSVWSPEKGDGVLFEIYIKEKDSEKLLFSKYIDPKNNPEERKWNDFEVGLSHWENENVTIIFATSPGPNNDSTYDWAWWGEPMIVSK